MAGFHFELVGSNLGFHVVEVDGVEAISSLYRFDVLLGTSAAFLDFDDLLGHDGLLTFVYGGISRHIHGMIRSVEHERTLPQISLYRVCLVPSLWRLERRFDCRIFQDLNVPQILDSVFRFAGIPSTHVHWRLARTPVDLHPIREYCVQYRESDWAFVSRLLEEEGLFYFFEHSAGSHALVISDHRSSHEPIAGDQRVFVSPQEGGALGQDYVKDFHTSQRVCSSHVTLRDYNHRHPSRNMEVHSPQNANDLEIYDYPGEYRTLSEGRALAEIRAEQARQLERVARGKGSCTRFAPGFTFDLVQHPREDLNRKYLLTSLRHHVAGQGVVVDDAVPPTMVYENEFECMPTDRQFRPERRTPRPTIGGVQTAVVTGPTGEEIYTDEQGRVKIQFHWDRRGLRDQSSSCWVRVSQGVAGLGWGASYLPRVGHEVIVSFEEGDPDRPIITGRVYHAENVPPLDLPAQKTRSTLRSSTTPGGGGFNELRFEDQAGAEEIYVHGQKDMNIEIENNRTERIGHNESVAIGANQTTLVGGARAVTVALAAAETVGLAKALTVGAAYQVNVGGAMNTTVGAAQLEEVALTKRVIVGQKLELICGNGRITVESNGAITLEGTTIALKASGPLTINGSVVHLN